MGRGTQQIERAQVRLGGVELEGEHRADPHRSSCAMSSTRTVSCSQIACRHGPSSTSCCRSSIRLGNSDVAARDSRRPPRTASVMSACSAPGTSSTAARDDGHAALRHTRRSSRRGGDRVGADPCPVRRRRRTAAGRHRRAHDAARGVPVRSPPDARSRRRGGRRHDGRVHLRSRTVVMFSVVACSSKQLRTATYAAPYGREGSATRGGRGDDRRAAARIGYMAAGVGRPRHRRRPRHSRTAPGSRPRSRRPRESTRAPNSNVPYVLESSPTNPPRRSRSRRSGVGGRVAVTISFRCGEPSRSEVRRSRQRNWRMGE